jgi:hypothetical protein
MGDGEEKVQGCVCVCKREELPLSLLTINKWLVSNDGALSHCQISVPLYYHCATALFNTNKTPPPHSPMGRGGGEF